jgi:hypothetical protein
MVPGYKMERYQILWRADCGVKGAAVLESIRGRLLKATMKAAIIVVQSSL